MRACCQQSDNREPAAWDHPYESLTICRVCGAKHYAHHAQMGSLGITGAPMGDALAVLTADELATLAEARRAVEDAREAQRQTIRRVLLAHGLDPEGVYRVEADGRVRPAEAVH